jgi:hypothetical protein
MSPILEQSNGNTSTRLTYFPCAQAFRGKSTERQACQKCATCFEVDISMNSGKRS